MIQLKTDARLNIILPNTNKALAEAIKSATPEQLSTLKEGKDVKSLLTSVFQDKVSASKSDQTLMDILKNAPAFKNTGSFSDNLASLVSGLKSSPDLPVKFGSLETFFKQFSSLNGETLKTQLANSGVFMESKIAQAIQTLPSLKETLQSLQSLLSASTRPEIKAMAESVTVLMNRPLMQEAATDPKSALNLSNALKTITDTLRSAIAKNDVLYSKETAAIMEKFSAFTAAAPLIENTVQPQAMPEIKTALTQLYTALLSSTSVDSNSLLDTIEHLLQTMKSPVADESALRNELKNLSQQFLSAMEHADPVASKEIPLLLAKLDAFADPESLLLENALEKSLEYDMKSQLLKLGEELQNSAHPKAPELLEHVDKLLSQIDYHQLLSQLNASNSIYFPFAWDLLEEGSIGFKKTKEKKFYCEINLRLKEYGELNLMMALYDENQLEIQAHTEKPELKELLSEHTPQLRSLLIDAGLTPRRIRIVDMRESTSPHNSAYESDGFGSDGGFEVKV